MEKEICRNLVTLQRDIEMEKRDLQECSCFTETKRWKKRSAGIWLLYRDIEMEKRDLQKGSCFTET